MQALLNTQEIALTTSELATLTNQRHDNVLRDARNMLTELGLDPLRFDATYLDTHGREQRCYRLPAREVKILITGYSIPLRAKVIDRLEQLERGKAQTLPSNPLDLLALAVSSLQQQGVVLSLVQAQAISAEVKADSAIVTHQDSNLTSLQVSDLNRQVDNRACYWAMEHDVPNIAFRRQILAELKRKFLVGGVSARTFKEIPQKHYTAAMEFVRNWQPYKRPDGSLTFARRNK